jgi:uncharacterized membrane protein HdeD (DUF308 family)
MIFRYIFEQVVGHSIDILAWFLVSWAFLSPTADRGWRILAAIVAVVMIASYVGQTLEGSSSSTEDYVWMGISTTIGLLIGLLVARRSRSSKSSVDTV